jgi:hypothetical protein
MRQLERMGMEVGDPPPCGMFLWVDTGRDTNVMTEAAMEQGFLLAPGSLFSPAQLPSTHAHQRGQHVRPRHLALPGTGDGALSPLLARQPSTSGRQVDAGDFWLGHCRRHSRWYRGSRHSDPNHWP